MSLPNRAVAEILREQESYSEKACDTRVSHARSIIRAGRAPDALLMIASASNVPYQVAQQAKALANDFYAR